MIEYRHHYEPTEAPPEGYVFLHGQWKESDDSMHYLYGSSAAYSPDRKTVWIKCRRITEQRTVSDWTRVD